MIPKRIATGPVRVCAPATHNRQVRRNRSAAKLHYLSIDGLPEPVAFDADTLPVAEKLRTVLKGWPTSMSHVASAAPCMVVRREGPTIFVESPAGDWSLDEPTETCAVCSLVIEIVTDLVETNPSLGSLHCASAVFADRLVVFPATHHAGKSTLAANLAARGHRVFGDDLLPIDLSTGEGIATGCPPRLRLPLPGSVAPDFARWVHTNTLLSDGRYCYVRLPDSAPVSHGDRAPVGAVVLLDRRDGPIEARLEPALAEDGLLELLLQNTKDSMDPHTAFRTGMELIEGKPALRLVYSDLEQAVRLLEETFADWQSFDAASTAPLIGEGSVAQLPLSRSPDSGWRRREGVDLKIVGSAGFLVDPETGKLHHLNEIGVAIWNLLAEPVELEDIVALFADIFSDVSTVQLREDVERLISELAAAGLVVGGR